MHVTDIGMEVCLGVHERRSPAPALVLGVLWATLGQTQFYVQYVSSLLFSAIRRDPTMPHLKYVVKVE